MLDVGCRMQHVRCVIKDEGRWIQDVGCWMLNVG